MAAARRALAALALLFASCDSSAAGSPDGGPGSPDGGPAPGETRFTGKTAVKVVPAGDGWLALLETLPNEALAVRLAGRGLLAISGMLDGPGTHAEVRSDGFLDVRELATELAP
jgi:hypothetical protein